MRTYAIGDIHGMLELLHDALAWIGLDAAGERSRVVFLGDYVDRGPSSRQVLERLIAGPPPGQEWICLRGNHEQMMADAVANPGQDASLWLDNGGAETMRGYRVEGRIEEAALARHAEWAEALPYRFEDEHRHYVHAGFRPGIPVERQVPEDMLWIRGLFHHSRFDFGKPVIHGHTPQRDVEIQRRRINLDTGACFGGALSVARWLDGQAGQPRFEQFRS
jgi:serine/threonine protein phosphatase 1